MALDVEGKRTAESGYGAGGKRANNSRANSQEESQGKFVAAVSVAGSGVRMAVEA